MGVICIIPIFLFVRCQLSVVKDNVVISLRLARIFHELLSRDHEDGCATGQLVPRYRGIGSEAYLERYVAGADTRGRQEGRPYPWSQQVIHEISGLGIRQLSDPRKGKNLLP